MGDDPWKWQVIVRNYGGMFTSKTLIKFAHDMHWVGCYGVRCYGVVKCSGAGITTGIYCTELCFIHFISFSTSRVSILLSGASLRLVSFFSKIVLDSIGCSRFRVCQES